ncbi:MAG: YqcC family protein [Bacteroidetes bacterium]|nr:YqcC family protein [Bacteroidota bacterium]
MAVTTEAGDKIREIKGELKRTGLWKNEMPVWVMEYEGKRWGTTQDFAEWLQFIYLPNCMHAAAENKKNLIVPQAIRFFEKDVQKGKLLQLLVELDALL